MARSVGAVYVTVLANTKLFEKEVVDAAREAGGKAGQVGQKRFREEFKNIELDDIFERVAKDIASDFDVIGKNAGTSLRYGLRDARISDALRDDIAKIASDFDITWDEAAAGVTTKLSAAFDEVERENEAHQRELTRLMEKAQRDREKAERDANRKREIEIKRSNKVVERDTESFVSRLNGIMRKFNPGNWFKGMDRTVALVLKAIVVAAEPVVAVLGAAAGGATALAASLGVALVGAAGALVPVLGALAASLGVVVLGFSNLFKKGAKLGPQAKEMKSALEGVKKALVDLRGPIQEALFDQLGKQIKAVTKEVLPEFKTGLVGIAEVMNVTMREGLAFLGGFNWEALFGGMIPIVGNVGAAVNDLIAGFFDFTLAATPAAQRMSEMFANTAQSLRDMIAAGAQSGSINAFLETGLTHLSGWWALLKQTTLALGDVAEVGASFGLDLVTSLTGIVEKWREWMGTEAGQASMVNFFTLANAALAAMAPILDGLKQAWSTLFTQQSVDLLAAVSEAIGAILPVLARLLAAVGDAGIIKTFADLLTQVATAITASGLLDQIGKLASLFGDALSQALTILSPYLLRIALVFNQLLQAVMPLVSALLTALMPVFDALLAAIMPLLPPIVDLVNTLVRILMPLLEPLGQLLATIAPILVQLFIAFNPVLRVIQLLAAVLPILEGPLTFLAEALGWLIEGFTSLIEPIVGVIAKVIEFFAGTKAVGDIVGVVGKLFEWLKPILGFVGDAFKVVGNAISVVGSWLSNTGGKLIEFASNMNIVKIGTEVVSGILRMLGGIMEGVGFVVTGLGNAFSRAFGIIVDVVQNALGVFTRFADKVMNSPVGGVIKGIGGAVGKLFASGGVVYGPTQAVIGEAGPEAVIPLTRPLNMIDPSVRGMAAMLRGMPNQAQAVSGGKTVNLTMNVYSPQADPAAVAASVMNRAAVLARG